ncbi:hypothetical protein GOV04_04300 [Candidatus Woesearchaeota archaeon]|nr:hypothetical protein [Candidatus Woesearchaeota archaeon]
MENDCEKFCMCNYLKNEFDNEQPIDTEDIYDNLYVDEQLQDDSIPAALAGFMTGYNDDAMIS